ncbi:Transcription factor TFIIB repeat [Carpediemonas membranifera]|uniref:Transcription factor TFIIB repeat n=1 Tax=Carpediemonas membranifera TaxID=201153 RepID=A0A8J6AYV3_9EUKA|nr:Transcription factor TFIIB repeat [Carpediemonas membranifera]|eukprot:KAG9394785.1 Transcription factor TFIIB repeat [Carpediemonas membranifera]
MHIGRPPAGLCGAAIFVAARIHGFERTQEEIMQVVHVHSTTIDKRLQEFSQTATAGLTVREFQACKADELEHAAAPAMRRRMARDMREMAAVLADPMLARNQAGESFHDTVWDDETVDDDPLLLDMQGQLIEKDEDPSSFYKRQETTWVVHEQKAYIRRLMAPTRAKGTSGRRGRRSLAGGSAAESAENVLSARARSLNRASFVEYLRKDVSAFTHNGSSAASSPFALSQSLAATQEEEQEPELEMEMEEEDDFVMF